MMDSVDAKPKHTLNRWALVVIGLLLLVLPQALRFNAPINDQPWDAMVYWVAGESMRDGATDLYTRAGWDKNDRPYIYPPAFAALFAPMTLIDDRPDLTPAERSTLKPYPFPAMLTLWAVLHWLAFVVTLWLLARLLAAGRNRWKVAAWAGLAVIGVAIFDIAYGNINLFVLLLLVAGVYCSETKRPWRAGLILGAAAMIKILPVVLMVIYLAQRRFRIAAGMLVAALVLALAPLPFTIAHHGVSDGVAQWWNVNIEYADEQVLSRLSNQDFGQEDFYCVPNNSPTSVLHRWFGQDTNLFVVVWDEDDVGPLLFALPKPLLKLLGTGLCAFMFALAVALALRRRDTVGQLGAVGLAFVAASMANVLFWHYHLIGFAIVGAALSRLDWGKSRAPWVFFVALVGLFYVPFVLVHWPPFKYLNRYLMWGVPTIGVSVAWFVAMYALWKRPTISGENDNTSQDVNPAT